MRSLSNSRNGKIDFDEETTEFLDALKPSTRRTYRPGLSAFQTYYGKPLRHFLDAVEEDRRRSRRERRRVARNTLKGFVEWMEKGEFKPKSIRTYVSAVQSLCVYYEIPVSTRYVNVPPSIPVSTKFPWTLEKVAELVSMIKNLEIKSMAISTFQAGLGISDLLALSYWDIKYEYENGIVPLCFDLARIKTDVPFMTFIGEWGVHILRQHLKGKRLTLNTPIYTISHRTIDSYFERLGQKLYGEYVGQNPMRPYTLRAAFRTLLGDAGMDRDVVKFFMGQRLPEQDRVYHSRSRDGWRDLYRKYKYALTPKNWSTI